MAVISNFFLLILSITALLWIRLIFINDTTPMSNCGKVTEISNLQSDAHG